MKSKNIEFGRRFAAHVRAVQDCSSRRQFDEASPELHNYIHKNLGRAIQCAKQICDSKRVVKDDDDPYAGADDWLIYPEYEQFPGYVDLPSEEMTFSDWDWMNVPPPDQYAVSPEYEDANLPEGYSSQYLEGYVNLNDSQGNPTGLYYDPEMLEGNSQARGYLAQATGGSYIPESSTSVYLSSDELTNDQLLVIQEANENRTNAELTSGWMAVGLDQEGNVIWQNGYSSETKADVGNLHSVGLFDLTPGPGYQYDPGNGSYTPISQPGVTPFQKQPVTPARRQLTPIINEVFRRTQGTEVMRPGGIQPGKPVPTGFWETLAKGFEDVTGAVSNAATVMTYVPIAVGLLIVAFIGYGLYQFSRNVDTGRQMALTMAGKVDPNALIGLAGTAAALLDGRVAHDARCVCDACVSDAFERQAGCSPARDFYVTPTTRSSLVPLAKGEYGRTYLDERPFRVEVSTDATIERQRLALTHELLHVYDEVHKLGIGHDQLHSLAYYILSEVMPGVAKLEEIAG